MQLVAVESGVIIARELRKMNTDPNLENDLYSRYFAFIRGRAKHRPRAYRLR